MKDNVLPRNAPPLGSIVGWEETYYTSQDVLSRHVVWGEVRDFYYHPGDGDGHHLQGDYVFVTVEGGGDCFIHINDIVSVNRPR